jgi:hypothetical protein
LLEVPPLSSREERERRVSSVELFFDLVFVFAFTQVTTFWLEHTVSPWLLRESKADLPDRYFDLAGAATIQPRGSIKAPSSVVCRGYIRVVAAPSASTPFAGS